MLSLKLWPDANDASWKQNVVDRKGGILLVSQFTLYAKTDKGSKPDFHLAMSTEDARTMFNTIVEMVKKAYPSGMVATGAFGELMLVDIKNHGPVTIILDSDQ